MPRTNTAATQCPHHTVHTDTDHRHTHRPQTHHATHDTRAASSGPRDTTHYQRHSPQTHTDQALTLRLLHVLLLQAPRLTESAMSAGRSPGPHSPSQPRGAQPPLGRSQSLGEGRVSSAGCLRGGIQRGTSWWRASGWGELCLQGWVAGQLRPGGWRGVPPLPHTSCTLRAGSALLGTASATPGCMWAQRDPGL